MLFHSSLETITAALNRDKNYLFKFKVGDRVKKAWKWTKEHYSRFPGNHLTMPMGSVGTIREISPDGEIKVDFRPNLHWNNWSLGASELDFAPLKCKECNDAGLHLCKNENCDGVGHHWTGCDSPNCEG